MPRTASSLSPTPATASADADGEPDDKAPAGSPDERLEKAIADDNEDAAVAIVNTDYLKVHRRTATVLDSAIKKGMSLLAQMLVWDGACTWQEPPQTWHESYDKSDVWVLPCCCLCTAVKQGDVLVVHSLILSASVGHYIHDYYYRHVHDFACYALAALEGKLEIIELLFSEGPTIPSRVHGTMLLSALRQDHPDIVHLLLRKGAHRPTFYDVSTAVREGRYAMLIDLVRAGGVDMRSEEYHNARVVLVRTVARVADAVCADKCPPEVLRRLLKCKAMAWTVDGTHARTPHRDYPVPVTTENRPQWLAVVGALTMHGWTCAASTPAERKHAADAHAAGCTADAAHDNDYADSVYDPKGDINSSDSSSSDGTEDAKGGDDASPSKRRRRA